MATILEHPQAQALLGSAAIAPEEVNACSRRLRAFLPVFEEGNGEVGLDHYEVRSWVGWLHHT